MISIYLFAIISFLIAFLVAYFFLKYYIPLALRRGFTGIDVHKANKPKVVDMGGFAIVFGFLFAVSFLFPFLSKSLALSVLAGVFAIVLTAFIGVFDDLFVLSPLKKIVLLLVASIPLIITRSGNPFINLPFFGSVSLGYFYFLVFIPLFFTVFANATNMLAGYNGLASGLGIISLVFLSIAALIIKNHVILYFTIPFLGALFGFYLFNKYPAKVFPGDVGNLTIGALIATAVIIANAETLALYFGILYLINFTLYFVYTFFFMQRFGDPKISNANKKDILEPVFFDLKKTNKKKIKAWHKLYFLFEHWFYPLTERKLVFYFFALHFLLNLIALCVWWCF